MALFAIVSRSYDLNRLGVDHATVPVASFLGYKFVGKVGKAFEIVRSPGCSFHLLLMILLSTWPFFHDVD